MSYHDRITLEPSKRCGKPCIRGMRITVYDVLNWMARGMTERQIVHDHPELVVEDIRACLAFAAFAADREHRLTVVTATDERALKSAVRCNEARRLPAVLP